ncbi:MAG: hypothetical protein E7265_02220 [Lachnospiraceae bacterium]|nr:hypothetical protein [Lachnospiraceae bacterium]
MIKFSVKKPYFTVIAVVIILIIGYVSLGKMKTDLLPDISMPYMMVITTEPGASPQKVQSDVTEPMENALGTISGVENVVSNSAENYSLVMLEFSSGTDMDSALVRVSAAINKLSLPELCGTPNILEIGMDMMATMYASVSYEGKDIIELTEFTDEVVVPYLERQTGVASITQIGSVTQTVEVRLNKERVDKLNDDILVYTNDKLADAKEKIDKGKKKLDKAEKELEKQQKALENKQNDANQGVSDAMLQLDKAIASKAAYEASLNSLKASKQALKAEKKAYTENKIQESYNQIDGMFKSLNASMGQFAGMAGIEIPNGIEDAASNKKKLNSFLKWMETMGYKEQVKAISYDGVSKVYDIVNVRIPQIDTELANLNTEILAAKAVIDAMNKKMDKLDAGYQEAYEGGLSASAGFGSASAQIASGKSEIEKAKKELDEAIKQFNKSKKTAKENANLDALLSLEALSGIVKAQNFSMPAGYINDKDDNQWLIKVGEEYDSYEDIQNMVLCKTPGVGVIKLKDVADVTLIDNSAEAYSKYNGNDAIFLAIYKASTANTSDVSDECYDAMDYLEKKYQGMKMVSFSDQSQYIAMFLESVLSSIAIGAILAILVLVLFLKRVKPTIVVAFSIPFSVLFAIIIMYFTGIDINVMSLAGLGLAIGMLVDNSIVVIENICSLREKGIAAPRAAVQGAKQVAGPITASTITTICVFLPMVFTEGLVRDLVVPFALTISYALTASLIVALIVVPTIGSAILKNTKEVKQPIFSKLQNAYGKALEVCLKYKFIALIIAIGLLVFSIYEVFRMGIVMIPPMTGDTISVTVEAPEGATGEEAVELSDKVIEAVMSVDGVNDVGAIDMRSSLNMFVGGAAGTESESEFSTFSLFVIPDKDIKSVGDFNRIIDEIEEKTKDFDGNVMVASEESASQFLSSGVQINIYGEDENKLIDISNDVMDLLEGFEGLSEISNGIEESDKAIHLSIDKDKAAKKGLTVAQIYAAISEKLTTEKDAAKLSLDGTNASINIINETNSIKRENLLDMELEATKMNADGTSKVKKYKLSEFATEQLVDTAKVITRENQTNYISVTASVDADANAALLSRDIEPALEKYQTPEGYTIEIAGESEEVMNMLSQMLLAIVLGLLFIYLVMVAQFQSLLSPFIVLFTIPLAFTGGFVGLFIAGEEISAMSLMGFMVLMGTVVNNGIVFVDYVNQLRIQGLDKRKALIATGKSRLRPILMTALTTILAMSNMIFTQDASAAMSKGMAIVISGGLLYSTLMTLFIVPIMYDILFRKKPTVIDVGEDLDDALDLTDLT